MGEHAVAGRLAEAGCQPSSTLLGVTRLAFPELLVEIEATAVVYIPSDIQVSGNVPSRHLDE